MRDLAPTAILPALDPLAAAIARSGWAIARAAIEYRVGLSIGVSLFLVLLALACRGSGRRVAWLAAALAAATWGQAVLFSDRLMLGAILFALAVLLAIPFGAANPLRAPRASTPGWRDALLLLAITALALVARLYALDQLPATVDFEATQAFFESLTPHGLAHYIQFNRVEDDGFFHMLARYAVQRGTGPGVLGIRLAGVLCGTAAVPLCYALVRRMTGVLPAALAALVLATAPEQLIFSRIETTQFALVPLAALLTAHLTLSLVNRWRLADAAATALWMPLSRYFYAPAIVLFLLPVAAALHGVVVGPWRRRAAAVLPVLFAGTVLWLGASPALRWAATGTWGEASSLRVYGVDFFRPYEIDAPAGAPTAPLDLLRTRLADNSVQVLRQLGHHRPGYSAWYLRDHPDEKHLRMICAALLVPLAAAIGMLLGRWRDPRAALLLAWMLLGLLPGVMTDEPDPRRLTVFFAAVPVVLGVLLDAMRGAVHVRRPRLAGWPLAAALVGAALLIAITSLAAHLRIYRARMMFRDYVDCTRPLFEDSDLILHNIDDDNTAGIIAFGNVEVLRRRLPGLRHQRDWDSDAWSASATDVRCPFTSDLYAALLDDAAIAARCDAFAPARVTYLLRVQSDAEQALAQRVLARFPDAALVQCVSHDRDDPIGQLIGLTVDR